VNVPHLYLVAARALFEDDAAWLQALERVATAAVEVRSVRMALQVRFEASPGAAAVAQDVLQRLRRANPSLPLWLNARAGVDAEGYDGLHLPQSALSTPPRGNGLPWAASVHSIQTLHRAASAGAAFAVFGALWKPQWKDAATQGIDALRRMTRETELPVVAIGGVTPERVASCLRAGAAGVAVASGIFAAGDVQEALRAYVESLSRALAAL